MLLNLQGHTYFIVVIQDEDSAGRIEILYILSSLSVLNWKKYDIISFVGLKITDTLITVFGYAVGPLLMGLVDSRQ